MLHLIMLKPKYHFLKYAYNVINFFYFLFYVYQKMIFYLTKKQKEKERKRIIVVKLTQAKYKSKRERLPVKQDMFQNHPNSTHSQ